MATTDDAEKPKRRPKTKKKVADEQLEDEPSSYPKPDDGPDALVFTESRLRAEQRYEDGDEPKNPSETCRICPEFSHSEADAAIAPGLPKSSRRCFGAAENVNFN